MQKNYFIAQESSRYSVRKQDWFFAFCVYKNVSQKLVFVYKWKLKWLPSSKDNVHVFIHTKAKKLRNVFIYKKPYLFQKARQFPLRFYIQKTIYFTLQDFSWIFEAGIFIQKAWHFALREIFIYKKLDTSQKARQFAIRFYIQKSGTLCYVISHWIFRFAEGGGAHLFLKKNALCVTFIYWKTTDFALRCYI